MKSRLGGCPSARGRARFGSCAGTSACAACSGGAGTSTGAAGGGGGRLRGPSDRRSSARALLLFGGV
eukprot:13847267-Alexandrium_andersonii.AAC.1